MNDYQFSNVEVYTKGDLKGYTQGFITFYYDDQESTHEFLYRFDDEVNGENFKLVSIDYGYHVPNIKKDWQDIENDLKIKTLQVLS